MKDSRFNFNLISHRDLRKFLTKKMESEKWEFSSAYDATLAHYQYQPKISYGFPHSRNMKLITKRLLRELQNDFILPFLCFNKNNMNTVLTDNSEFLEEGIYYFRNAEGKRELYNYPVKSLEQIQKIVDVKYKKSSKDTQFILEKSVKKPLAFNGNAFELRMYLLIIRIGTKYHSFLYPSVFANFGKDNINKEEFLKCLGFMNEEGINGLHPLMKDIYKLSHKTALVISNYLGITNKVYRVENEIKLKNKDIDYFKSEFQYNLYGLDITINNELKPFLSDIVFNPIFGIMDSSNKIAKEKAKMYNDVIDNFIAYYNNHKSLNFDNSNFILLNETSTNQPYKWFVGKKLFDENGESKFDDSLEYATEIQDFITQQGEELVQNILFENKVNLSNDNLLLVNKIGLKPSTSEQFINSDYLISSATGGLGEEYEMKTDLESFVKAKKVKKENCDFVDDKVIETKIKNLKVKEKNQEIYNLAKNTLPILGLAYAAKKTLNAFGTKKQVKEEEIIMKK